MQAVETIEDLSDFLRRWYDDDDLGLLLNTTRVQRFSAQPLLEIWERVGKLCAPVDRNELGPLATQDRLAEPGKLVEGDGFVRFATENQKGWTWAYRSDFDEENPLIYSDFVGEPFRAKGQKLAEFLIEFALSETVFFSWDRLEVHSDEKRKELYDACTIPVTKHPNELCRTNGDQTLLLFEYDDDEGVFVGERDVARQRWRAIRRKYFSTKKPEAFGLVKTLFKRWN